MHTRTLLALTAPLFLIGCLGDKDPGADSDAPSNSPPSITAASVSPTQAYEDSTLSCAAEGWSDADDDPEAVLITWLVNDNAVAETETLTGSAFNKGDRVICELTPDDGVELGEPVSSAPVVVLNTPPVALSPSLDLSEASVLDTLSAGVGGTEDLDGDQVTMRWNWFVNGIEVDGGDSLALADHAVRGDEVYAVGVPNDGDSDGEPVTTDTLTVGNAPAQVTELTLDPPEAHTYSILGFNLSVEDPDGDEVSWTHQWVVNGNALSETDIYLEGDLFFSKDDEVWVEITTNDGIEDGPPVESEHITVLNTSPGGPLVDVTPPRPAGGQQDITCRVTRESEDVDGDVSTYAFAWEVDGVAYSGATDYALESVVPAADQAEGQQWVCVVTPNDGEEDGDSASDGALVGPALPDLDLDGDTQEFTDGTYAYYDINVVNGGLILLVGDVQLTALNSFTLDSSSSIDGNEGGHAGGDSTPSVGDGDGGGGVSTNSGAGGGGYGGDGGEGGYDSSDTPGAGGLAYGSETDPSIQMGSGGGGSQDGDGGAGGAALTINAPTINIAGLIDLNGGEGATPLSWGRGGGGGSGGGALLIGDVVSVTGEINVIGGDGGTSTEADNTTDDDGGGGGGGRIKIFYDTSLDTTGAILDASGAAGGPNGSASGGADGVDGTVYEAQATYVDP